LTKIFNAWRTVARCVGEDIAEAPPGLQSRSTKRQREVVDQKRPVRDTQTVIPSNLMSNTILKQQQLQRLGAMKPKIVDIDHCLRALRDFNIESCVVNKNPRIHKISLPLDLAASQTRQQTVRLDQPHARLRQANPIANPECKLPTNKIRIVEDRIEARRMLVCWIRITLRPEERAPEPEIITVD